LTVAHCHLRCCLWSRFAWRWGG